MFYLQWFQILIRKPYFTKYENSESKVFKNIKILSETSNNWPKDLLGINVYKTLESCW